MDKPLSLSVKQFIIRKMAVYMAVPEKTIEAVVNHQFSTMLDQMATVESVELSGFGKFLFNNKKALRFFQNYEKFLMINNTLLSMDISAQKRRNLVLRNAHLEGAIEALKPRMNETKFQGDLRGVEKPSVSSREIKAANPSGVKGKAGDMQNM